MHCITIYYVFHIWFYNKVIYDITHSCTLLFKLKHECYNNVESIAGSDWNLVVLTHNNNPLVPCESSNPLTDSNALLSCFKDSRKIERKIPLCYMCLWIIIKIAATIWLFISLNVLLKKTYINLNWTVFFMEKARTYFIWIIIAALLIITLHNLDGWKSYFVKFNMLIIQSKN